METLTMNQRERERMKIMVGVHARELTLVPAAELLGVSYRQCKRIWHRYQAEGDAGLVRRKVIVRTLRNGQVQLVQRGQSLRWRRLPVGVKRTARPETAKPVPPRKTKAEQAPAANQPWRRFGAAAGRKFRNGDSAAGGRVRAPTQGKRTTNRQRQRGHSLVS